MSGVVEQAELHVSEQLAADDRDLLENSNAVTIETGPTDWQIIQQDRKGVASVSVGGSWWTIVKRDKPLVRVRIVRESDSNAVSSKLDWMSTETELDYSVDGAEAGRCGSWKLKIRGIPRGGPYRIETCVGTARDAIEWCRRGDMVHHLGVGDVWLITGQSNASGVGRDPVDDPPEMNVHMFGADGKWKLACHPLNDSTGSRYEHNQGGGVVGHSPWLAFAKKLKRELGYPIGLVNTAKGGSAVSQWDPGHHGTLFDSMKRCMEDSGAGIRGAVWYQGETDASAGEQADYRLRFLRFLMGLRQSANWQLLPVITVQLNRHLGAQADGKSWEAMREIQRKLANELDDVFIVPTFEAGLCDGVHNSAQGNMLLAKRVAATALGGAYGQDLHFRNPECVSAKVVGRNAIDLRFANVVERLDYACAIANGFPFAVRDAEGDVPVVGYAVRRRDTFRIELDRPLRGAATITGAPGACPPQIMPKDIDGYRCMLGFTIDVAKK